MAADGADSVHVWKSKVLNVQLKKKVLLLRVWSCRTFTVVSSVLLKQWFSYPLIPSLWWWTGEKKKKKQTQTYFWSETRYRYIFMHTKKASFPTFGECHNIVTMLSCVERQMENFLSEEQKVHATIATLNYFIFYYFFFCTVFTECPQVCLLHLAPSCHPFGQNLDSIAPQSQ